MMIMPSKFKICSVGCGNIATNIYGPSYLKYAEENPEVVLAACCDANESKAAGFKERFGFRRCYTDAYEMLQAEKPDAVCLLVPPDLIARVSVRIMDMGYPLLMEKPPGMNRDETIYMINSAEKSGVANQVAFNRRYAPAVVKFKEIFGQTSKADDIININYEFSRVGRTDRDFSTTCIHGIDTVGYIAGCRYSYIKFRYQDIEYHGEKAANIFMDCLLESGATAQISFCPLTGASTEWVRINTVDNSFFLNIFISDNTGLYSGVSHFNTDKAVYSANIKNISDSDEEYIKNRFYNEIASFFNDIRWGRKPRGDIRSGLQPVEIADCIRQRLGEYVKPVPV